MNLQYVKQPNLTDQELIICQDYYTTPLDEFESRLAHLKYLCDYYHITLNELSDILKKVKVFNTDIHCIECQIAKIIKEPTHYYQRQIFSYICNDCHQFIYHQLEHIGDIKTKMDASNDYFFGNK